MAIHIVYRPYPASLWLAAAGILVAILTYAVLLGDGHLIFVFAGKEQLFEVLSALFLALASMLCFVSAQRSRRAPAPTGRRDAGAPSQGSPRRAGLRPYVYLLLGIFFFVAAGEELSWGQHYLGYDTPESVSGLNQQQELNIHNLWFLDSQTSDGRRGGLGVLLNSNRLFDYFMFGLFVLLPAGHRLSPLVRRLSERFGLPVVAGVLALPLLVNVALTVVSELRLATTPFRHMAVSEIRECNYAFRCQAGVWYLFMAEGRRRGADTA